MKQFALKQFYEIHSWVGTITAILMFIIALTGAVSVFGSPELKVWSYPSIHEQPNISPETIEQLVRGHAATLPDEYLEHVDIIMPAVRRSDNLIIQFEKEVEQDGRHWHVLKRFYHHPHTLEVVSEFEGTQQDLIDDWSMDLAEFIITFHADLHLGNPWGLILTGFLGLTLFSSIVSGVIIHRKILKEIFVFRPSRSLRLLWNDSHKVLGVWGILFHTVIAFTGAFLGLAAVVLVPAAAFVSFGGDQEALVEAVLPEIKPNLTGIEEQLYVAKVIEEFQNSEKGDIVSVSLVGGKDTGALVVVNSRAGDGIPPETIQFMAKSGELVSRDTTYSRIGGFSGPVLDAFRPLHYGDFGGVAVKLIWGVLGVGTAMLALSGMMIWIERRAYGPTGKLSERTYLRISRFTIGSCVGLVGAITALFYGQRFLYGKSITELGYIFFAVWLLAIVWAQTRRNEYIASRHLCLVSGVLLLLLPLASGIATGSHLFNVFQKGHFQVAGVEVGLLLIGALMTWLSRRIPTERPARKATREEDKTNFYDEEAVVS